MRLLVLFLVYSIGLSYAADSYAQKAMISIDVHNQRVEDILKEIEAQSDFDFFFNNKHVDLNRRVSVSADKSNIFNVLQEVFAGTNVKYSVLDKKIILSVEVQSPQAAAAAAGHHKGGDRQGFGGDGQGDESVKRPGFSKICVFPKKMLAMPGWIWYSK